MTNDSLIEKLEARKKLFEENADDFDRGTVAGLLEAIALVRQQNEGDASTRKDEDGPKPLPTPSTHTSDCKTNGYDTSDGIKYAQESECDCQGEISVLSDDALYELISEAIPTSVKYEARHESIKGVVEAIRPYLRTTEPVTVSLEKCAKALFDFNISGGQVPETWESANNTPHRKDNLDAAKTVLDAAGVAYVN